MSDLSALLLLLVLGSTVGLWFKLSVARERAVVEARRQCQQYGLQLLDETVGLRALRLRKVNGLRMIERGYGFEVSVEGHDRQAGRLWMIGDTLTHLSLPTIEPPSHEEVVAQSGPHGTDSNVTPLRPRIDNRLN